MPSSSDKGDVDTPLRKFIRQLPDLVEEFLDKCYEIKVQTADEGKPTSDEQEVITMNYDFIEDTYKYNIMKSEDKSVKNEFRPRTAKNLPPEYNKEKHVVTMANHPMVIMTDTKNLISFSILFAWPSSSENGPSTGGFTSSNLPTTWSY